MALCADGEVYSWGSNSYGQLGSGDNSFRSTPYLIKLPPKTKIVQIAAGSNHSVLLSSNGEVFTFGSHLVSSYFIFYLLVQSFNISVI